MTNKNQTVPRVSIGVPVYNGAAFLAESLDSLLSQTYGDFELTISDNASTDETESICRSYAARDKRICYYRQQENIGATANFNRVFELSRGEYFKWAAHDDICGPTFLQRCVDALDHDPTVAWCHSQSVHVDRKGRVLGEPISYVASKTDAEISPAPGNTAAPPCGSRATPPPTRASQRVDHRLRAVMLGGGGCIDSFALFRSEIIRRTPLYLPYFGSEKVFIAEIALWGRYHEIPEPLFFERLHAEAAGSQGTATQQQAFINPLRKGRLEFTRLSLLSGYIRAVSRANLTAVERVRCFGVIIRYLMQVDKWKRVVTKTLTGAGLAEDFREIQQAAYEGNEIPESPLSGSF